MPGWLAGRLAAFRRRLPPARITGPLPRAVTVWASSWPLLTPETSYPGDIVLTPDDTTFPDVLAIYTDGSLSATSGGAAAVSTATAPEQVTTSHVLAPRSSTHCELVALNLALRLQPPAILTDSLASLSMLRWWGTWSTARTLACPDRVELREAIHTASLAPIPATLEKVKAHQEAALAAGWPKAVGNDLADTWAKRAAMAPDSQRWVPDFLRFGDPVELVDASGLVVLDILSAFQQAWWVRSQQRVVARRPLMNALYPPGLAIDWTATSGIFRRPTVSGGAFVHAAKPKVIKWLSRVRAGCLASGDRLHRHGQLRSSPGCLLCSAELEDDLHVLLGCPTTGSVDWAAGLHEVWQSVANAVAPTAAPPTAWLAEHRLPLLAAIVPSSLQSLVPAPVASRFALRLHQALAVRTADLLWRREALRILAAPPDTPAVPLHQPCPLPPERQLSPGSLSRLEVERRRHLLDPSAVPTSPTVSTPQAPASGESRRRWLRDRLVALLASDTVVCAPNLGATAEELSELFERVTGEHFSDTPGVAVTGRVRSLAKVMGNLTRAGVGQPPLLAGKRRAFVTWSRVPRRPADVAAWRRREEQAEETGIRPRRRRVAMAEADAGLASWVRNHMYIAPAAIDGGESGMALLLLWEIDHGCPWPSAAAEDDRSGLLTGFTRRLMRRVAEDDVLSQWMLPQDQQRPLASGLADTHNFRWPVVIRQPPPDAPQGWWLEFTEAWRTYLTTQLPHLPAAPLAHTLPDASSSSTVAAQPPSAEPTAVRRPRLQPPAKVAPRSRRPPIHRPRLATSAPLPPDSPASPVRPNQPSACTVPQHPRISPPRKRQTTLAAWRRPVSAPSADDATSTAMADPPQRPAARHGRATEGDPT